MKCSEAPELLVSLLYDELSDPEKKDVGKHLKQCENCRETYREMQSTSQMMAKWEDVSPPNQTLFIEEKASLFSWIKNLGWAGKLAWGAPAFAMACLFILSVSKADMQFQNGEFRISFGRQPVDEAQYKERLASAIQAYQEEQTSQLVQLIHESEARQSQNITLAMNRYAKSIEQQRLNDLRLVDQGFQGLQRQTSGQIIRTQSMIDDLLRNANYSPDQGNR